MFEVLFSFLFHRNLNAIYLTKNNSTPQTTQSGFQPAAPPVFSLLLFIDKRLPFLKLRFTQKYHREQPQPHRRMTWRFSFQRLKCFPYCGTPNGCRKCCHSAPLSKLPEWGFGSGGCQCGRSQSGTDPARVSSCWGIVQERPPRLGSPASDVRSVCRPVSLDSEKNDMHKVLFLFSGWPLEDPLNTAVGLSFGGKVVLSVTGNLKTTLRVKLQLEPQVLAQAAQCLT